MNPSIHDVPPQFRHRVPQRRVEQLPIELPLEPPPLPPPHAELPSDGYADPDDDRADGN
jgi:hypothetical protein